MRAREADSEGYAEHDGVKIFYEVFGEGDVTMLVDPRLAARVFPSLEGPDPLPGSPLPCRDHGPARQRSLGSPDRTVELYR